MEKPKIQGVEMGMALPSFLLNIEGASGGTVGVLGFAISGGCCLYFKIFKVYWKLKNVKQEQAEFWKQHLALVKAHLTPELQQDFKRVVELAPCLLQELMKAVALFHKGKTHVSHPYKLCQKRQTEVKDPCTQGRTDTAFGTPVDLGKLNSQFEEISRSESTPVDVHHLIDQSRDRKGSDRKGSEPSACSTMCNSSSKPDDGEDLP